MTHQEAIDNHTAERYFLGELDADERGAFEEHYFDCYDCAADVRDESAVISGIRAAGRGARRHNFIPTLAAAASFAIAVAAISYQQVAVVAPLRAQVTKERAELSKERQPRIVSVYELKDSRGPQEQTVEAGKPFLLRFEIPPVPSPLYRCAIVDAGGKSYGTPVSVTAAEARHVVDLNVPGGLLGAGDYSLDVTNTRGESVFKVGFRVR